MRMLILTLCVLAGIVAVLRAVTTPNTEESGDAYRSKPEAQD